MLKEQFENPADQVLEDHNVMTDDVFDKPTSSNPFGNVLVTDIEYNPNKKPAPPAFNENINDWVNKIQFEIDERTRSKECSDNPVEEYTNGLGLIADNFFIVTDSILTTDLPGMLYK